MKSKKYWLNIPLLKNIIKRNFLPVKISLVLFASFLMLSILSDAALGLAILIFCGSAFILTTIYASLIQEYLSNRMEASYVKTMPISTKTMWLTQYVAGFLLIFSTLIIEVTILCIRVKAWQPEFLYGYTYYIKIVATILLLVFIYYSIAFFVVCISGKKLGHFLFTIACYGLPALLYFGVLSAGGVLTEGTIPLENIDFLSFFLPILSGIEYVLNKGYTWFYFSYHLLGGILFFIGSYFAYKHRPLEKTDHIIIYQGISYIIRASIVIVITIVLYLFCIVVGELCFTYGNQDMMLHFVLFMCIGLVCSLGMELLFKNKYLYRTVALYLGIIGFSFFACYQLGNINHQYYLQEIQKQENILVNVTRYRDGDIQSTDSVFENNDFYFSLTPKNLEIFTQFLHMHKERVYSTIPTEGSALAICIYGEDTDPVNTLYCYYYIKESLFEKFYYENPDIVKEMFIFTIDKEGGIGNEYWFSQSTDENVTSLISTTDLENLIDIMAQQDMTYEERMQGRMYLFSDDTNWYHINIPASKEIDAIIQKEENVIRGRLLEQAMDMVQDALYSRKAIEEVKDIMIVEGNSILSSSHIELYEGCYFSQVKEISDTHIVFNVPIWCIYEEGLMVEKSVIYTVDIHLVRDGDAMVFQKMVEKGEYHETYLEE